MLLRLCPVRLAPADRSTILARPSSHRQLLRNFGSSSRSGVTRRPPRAQTSKARAFAPARGKASKIGPRLVAGAAALGLAALAFHGSRLSSETGSANHAVLWPNGVRVRVRDTFLYFGGSVAIMAASATTVLRSPAMMDFVKKSGFKTFAASVFLLAGSLLLVESTPYREGFGQKQLAWMLHTAVDGAVIATFCQGPVMLRGAWYAAGAVAGLSTAVVSAPSAEFLSVGAPLGMLLGVICAAAMSVTFLAPSSAVRALLTSIAVYGGLLFYSLRMLYCTEKFIHKTERYSLTEPFDPINESIHIFRETIDIFNWIVQKLVQLWPSTS